VIPVLLLGVKYCVDLIDYHQACLYGGGTDLYKKCAREAVLAVAKKWNPGLTLKQQKESLLLIADDIYNKNPCYCGGGPAHRAIPGLEIKDVSAVAGRPYDPLRLIWSDTGNVSGTKLDASGRKVKYIDDQQIYYRDVNAGSDLMELFNCALALQKLSHLLATDGVWEVSVDASNWPTRYGFIGTSVVKHAIAGSGNYPYTKREDPTDTKVQISVENNRIRVQTDDDFAYAVPAECNVDIVLSIPTHRDAPLVEIVQAYRKFLADNFEFTRGVNVGLIPYSGKVSFPYDRDGWAYTVPAFNSSTPYVKGCFLYGSKGTQNTALTVNYNNWGNIGIISGGGGRAVMCRENLLSEAAPDSRNTNTLFRRANDQPCVPEYANFLSMKCEQNCTRYYHNPFFIVELIADVGKMRDLLNVVVPFNDAKNSSNFIFIPVTWANNLFQDWTNDPEISAQNTTGAIIADGGHLSCLSKMTGGRKKVLILIVNKPDCFEPNELTYLGFDNDYREVSKIATETIDFSNNFGTAIQSPGGILTFTGTGVTRSSGFYECTSGTGKLSFPQKYLVKIVVEAIPTTSNTSNAIEWKAFGSTGEYYLDGICAIGNVLYAMDSYYSQLMCLDTVGDKTWKVFGNDLKNIDRSGSWGGLCAIRNILYTMEYTSGQLVCLDTVGDKTWKAFSDSTARDVYSSRDWYGLCAIGDILYAISIRNGQLVYLDTVGDKTWKAFSDSKANDAYSSDSGTNWISICAIGNILYTMDKGSGQLVCLDTVGDKTWKKLGNNTARSVSPGSWSEICAIGNILYAVNYSNSGQLVCLDTVGDKTWKKLGDNTANDVQNNGSWSDICAIGNILYTLDIYYIKLACLDTNPAPPPPPAVSSITIAGATRTISARTTFYVEPSQISNTKDTNGNYNISFNMSNIRLISAEITNRPYTMSNGVVTFAENHVPDTPSSGVAPVNSVLYYGAGEEGSHQYAWQSSNRVGSKGVLLTESETDSNACTATTAVRHVTIDACEKLKDAEYSENLHIYVVKYKKQGENADYGYIDDCATENNSTYVKEAATADDLKTVLQQIADDIKENFAVPARFAL
jgi:hypothetical protein